MLKLRSIGTRDYSVYDDEQRIGRIRFADERMLCVWLWSVTIHLTARVVFPERRASPLDLRPALFRELLHSMFLVVGDSPCKRHRTRHANMSEGDKECLFFIQRNEVAHDTAFITSIRQV